MVKWKELDEFTDELLRDPVFKEKFEAGEPDHLIAREILAARRSAGMSQEALAKAIGTSQSRVSKWERAEETPRLEALYKIAAATGHEVHVTFDKPRPRRRVPA